VRRHRAPRSDRTDLLSRPPSVAADPNEGWASLIVDRVAQLRTLADLLRDGLLSREEFERQKAKVFES
jgi:hypothetical protein